MRALLLSSLYPTNRPKHILTSRLSCLGRQAPPSDDDVVKSKHDISADSYRYRYLKICHRGSCIYVENPEVPPFAYADFWKLSLLS